MIFLDDDKASRSRWAWYCFPDKHLINIYRESDLDKLSDFSCGSFLKEKFEARGGSRHD